jgi:endonuclease/exonuclease/phosphatase (EEP) superfamily protein YafD
MLLLRFCLFCCVVVSFAPLLQRLDVRFAAFDAFALQCAAGNLILVLAILVFRRRLRSYRWWALAGLIGAAWSIIAVWPEMTFRGPTVAEGPVLRVVNLNIWWDNDSLAEVVDYLSTDGPEIVGLVEVTSESKAALAPLRAVYPYSVDCVEQGRVCQEMLLSKLPLRRSYAGPVGGAATYVAEAEIEWQGRTITVTVTHLPVPSFPPYRPEGEPDEPLLPGTANLWQSQQAAVLARHFAQPGAVDRIVLGDFNSVLWNPLQRAFRAATGLENRGKWTPSWPSWHPFFARIPIDPVFTGGGLTVRSQKTGRDVGSDHLPVEAEIAVRK